MAENLTRGESGNGGESLDSQRQRLAARLEAVGHGGCAHDLEVADVLLVADVAYGIVDHLVRYCGAPREQDQPIARDLQAWATRFEAELAS
jgi:hypothetical protein